jgi:hypothetical protein
MESSPAHQDPDEVEPAWITRRVEFAKHPGKPEGILGSPLGAQGLAVLENLAAETGVLADRPLEPGPRDVRLAHLQAQAAIEGIEVLEVEGPILLGLLLTGVQECFKGAYGLFNIAHPQQLSDAGQ